MNAGYRSTQTPRIEEPRLLPTLTTVAIPAGSLLLWIGIPAGWVWLGTSLAGEQDLGYGIALVGAPPCMVVWAWILYRLQLVRNRLSGLEGRPGARAGWLRSLSAERDEARGGSLLESSLVLSAVLAAVAFGLWLVLGPPAPWPSWR